jgi:hypothetical protein
MKDRVLKLEDPGKKKVCLITPPVAYFLPCVP